MNVLITELNTELFAQLARKVHLSPEFDVKLITYSERFKNDNEYEDITSLGVETNIARTYFSENQSQELDHVMDEILYMLRRIINIGGLREDLQIQYVRQVVAFWKNYLQSKEIGIVIFTSVPHVVYDFIIYELCKKFNILTVFIEKTFWSDSIIVATDFRRDSSVLPPVHDAISINQALKKINEYSSSLSNNSVPYWTKYKINRQKKTIFEKIITLLTSSNKLQKILKKIKTSILGFYWGQFYTGDQLSKKGIFWHLLVRLGVWKRKYLIKREFVKCALKNFDIVDDKRPYIVFFLQCQPEKSTSPIGGKFADQLYATKKIRDWLPDNVDLIVREHPSQFKSFQRLEKGRYPGFYEAILETGAKLVSFDVDKNELTSNAIGIISVSGSVVFEQYLLQKKSAYMGYPWFKDIKTISKVDDSKSMAAFVEKCLDGELYAPDLDEVASFLSKMHYGYMDEIAEKTYSKNINQEVNEMLRTIQYFVAEYEHEQKT